MSKKNPQLRFEGFTDDWEQRKLESLCEVFTDGDWIEAKDQSNSGVRLIQTGNIGITEYLDKENNKKWISEETLKRLRCEEVYPGDILISRLPDPAGRACILPNLGIRMITAVDCTIIRTSKEYDSKYLVQYLSTPTYFKIVNSFLGGGTRQRISRKNLSKIDIPVPHIFAEQQKIGEYFSNLDRLITLHQRKLDLLKEQKKGFLQKMFPKNGEKVPELRFAGFADDWEECKLGEVGNTFTGLSGKTKEDFGHGEGKFITYMNVFSNPVADLDGLESVEIDNKQFQVKAGDVLFTTSSETPEEVGMSSMWLGNADNIYLNSFCFGYRPTIEFDNYYLAFMFRSAPIRKKFQLLAQGISRYNISKNKVMEMSIPVPSIEEQEKIGSFFKHLDTLIALHQSKCDSLKELKKTLLRQLFV